MENEGSTEKKVNSPTPEKEGELCYAEKEDHGEQTKTLGISEESPKPGSNEGLDVSYNKLDDNSKDLVPANKKEMNQDDINSQVDESKDLESENKLDESKELKSENKLDEGKELKSENKLDESKELESENKSEIYQDTKETLSEDKEPEPVFDGTEIAGMEAGRSMSTRSLDLDTETQGSAWPEKAVALKNFVKEKGTVAVSSVFRVLSGKTDEDAHAAQDDEDKNDTGVKEAADSPKEGEAKEVYPKPVEWSAWNPLNYIKISREVDAENRTEQKEEITEEPVHPVGMKGRIILYTRLGCQESKEVRRFLHQKRLRYVEINIDVYPSRNLELDKIAGSSAVPKLFFNEVLIGGLNEIKGLEEAGKLEEKIDYVISEAPSFEAPLPPLSGEDDLSSSGAIDELAVIARKMKESIVVKDRFYRVRRFTNCFLGSEAVDFISEDQYLEREEAVEFGRKLASKHFFHNVLDENVFEDGNHLYRFLDHDPIVLSQCHNFPRGILDVKPKPIIEIASRLRFLSYAIFEAYTSEDGKHVDYRSIHGSEEFARYLRTVEELQRVDLQDIPREEKLAFFINLYNMMAIHGILAWGYPVGPLERRKLFGEFKYVVGGCTYSPSVIANGILRSNQRPPYNLTRPFGMRDRRAKLALPYTEPLIHFALVFGTRSGPALKCYSPGNIDQELVEAARNFVRSGGLILDVNAKVVAASKLLKWYSVDFGKTEVEVLKHAANYLEPPASEELLELLASGQLKVIYQPYDWGLNC